MASVESLQCPNCGNRIDAKDVGEIIRCDYCGSVLRVKEGASGSPMGELVRVGDHTELLALGQAADRIRGMIDKVTTDIGELEQRIGQLEAAKKWASSWSCGGIILLFTTVPLFLIAPILFLEGEQVCTAGILSALIPLVALTLWQSSLAKKRKKKISAQQERIKKRHAEKTSELEDLQSRLEEIESRMDDLADQI